MRATFLTLLLCFASCRGGAELGSPTAGGGSHAGTTAFGVERLYRSALSGFEDSLRLVVRDSATLMDVWARVRARHVVAGPPPVVDFERSSVVVAALGERPTTNFWIAVDSSFVVEGERLVSVTRFTVGADCSGGQMVTSPVELAALPNDRLAIRFVEHARVLPHCGGGRPGPPPAIP